MTEEQALLQTIADNPADDTARLVYADWLSENGRDEQGKFIRNMIANQFGPPVKPTPPRMWKTLFQAGLHPTGLQQSFDEYKKKLSEWRREVVRYKERDARITMVANRLPAQIGLSKRRSVWLGYTYDRGFLAEIGPLEWAEWCRRSRILLGPEVCPPPIPLKVVLSRGFQITVEQPPPPASMEPATYLRVEGISVPRRLHEPEGGWDSTEDFNRLVARTARDMVWAEWPSVNFYFHLQDRGGYDVPFITSDSTQDRSTRYGTPNGGDGGGSTEEGSGADDSVT